MSREAHTPQDSPRWPLHEPQDEFERITQDVRQERHDELLASMNVTLNTWRIGPVRIDHRPQSRWGWIAPSMFSLGRISIGWGR